MNDNTGQVIVKWGKWKGFRWSTLEWGTLEWYKNNLSTGPLGQLAAEEIERRRKTNDSDAAEPFTIDEERLYLIMVPDWDGARLLGTK